MWRGWNDLNYIYTSESCPKCTKQKSDWDKAAVRYVERSSDRLKGGHADFDDIDQDALVQLQMQNMKLPVIVNVQEV